MYPGREGQLRAALRTPWTVCRYAYHVARRSSHMLVKDLPYVNCHPHCRYVQNGADTTVGPVCGVSIHRATPNNKKLVT
jgi:hypothetical protein